MRLPFEASAAAELVRRFPYSIVTALVDGQRGVVAVAHDHRRPGYWNERLK